MSTSTGPRRLGKYELRELLGQGSMAEVWKAFDTDAAHFVTIKLLHAQRQLDPLFVSRFEREGKFLVSLHHPNILPMQDVQVARIPESQHQLAYIVTAYLEGPTLADYIASTSAVRKFPPVADIVYLFAAIANAIDYAHQQGVIHRDLQPANIVLNPNIPAHNSMGEPILTNFGIARVLSNSPSLASELSPGAEFYISPEQAQGYIGNERSDLYSLGVILYEICTGVRPFQGNDPTTIVQQHIDATPPSPVLLNPDISPALAMVILRSLAKDFAARFATASAMVAALAEAFNVPVPEAFGLAAPLSNAMNEPTYYKPRQSASLASVTPSTSVIPLNVSRTNNTTDSTIIHAEHRKTPLPLSSDAALAPSALLPSATSMPKQKRQRKSRLTVLIAALLLLLLVGSGLGTFFWFSHTGQTKRFIPITHLVGQAFFDSSGQSNENSSQGINDELQINLTNISAPPQGKSYFAWLLSDTGTSPQTSLLLGKLSVIHGKAQFLYPGNKPHTNLLTITSRLLITQEDATTTPTSPSSAQNAWRYYAALPQTPDPKDTTHHLKMLDYLRNLLAEDSTILAMGVHGGLDMHVFRNTEKMLEWAGSARDDWRTATSITLMRQLLVSILDYLDGTSFVQSDVPPGTPIVAKAPFAMIAPAVSTTSGTTNQPTSGYLNEFITQMNGIAQAPGGASDKLTHISQIKIALQNVKGWLEQVRQDAVQLLKMTNAQLRLPAALSILDDMYTQAFYAYVGRLNPATNKVDAGVIQIHYDTERLATFDIQSYTSS